MSDDNWLKEIGQEIIAAVEQERDRQFTAAYEKSERLKRLEANEPIGDYFRLRSVAREGILIVKLDGEEIGTVELVDDDYEVRASGDVAGKLLPDEESVRQQVIGWARDAIIRRQEKASADRRAKEMSASVARVYRR